MLILNIPVREYFNEAESAFVIQTVPVALEHSLVSIAKWEEKYERPFLSNTEELTNEQALDYVKMMVINPAVDSSLLGNLSPENVEQIQNYLNKKATATTVRDDDTKTTDRTIITAELIYYWMFSLEIPKECETWHINKLLMLIKVFNAKNKEADPKSQKKMTQAEIMARNRALNAKRLAGGKRG